MRRLGPRDLASHRHEAHRRRRSAIASLERSANRAEEEILLTAQRGRGIDFRCAIRGPEGREKSDKKESK